MFRHQRFSICLWTTVIAASAAALVLVAPIAMQRKTPFRNSSVRGADRASPNSTAAKPRACVAKATTPSNGGPHNLGISIRCANASAKIELRANLVDSGGSISGSWEERTYNQSGSVTGRASANKLTLAINGGINGSMLVTIGHRSHSVAVLTSGPSLKAINISMSR